MITIKRTLDRELENPTIKENRILQGNFSNLEFLISLADNGEPITITNIDNLNVIVKSLIDGRNITVPKNTITLENNSIKISGSEVLTNFSGTIEMTLQFENLYTFTTAYSVAKNNAYKPVPISVDDHNNYATKTDLQTKMNTNFDNAIGGNNFDNVLKNSAEYNLLKNSIPSIDNLAKKDVTNVLPADADRLIRLTNAYKEIVNQQNIPIDVLVKATEKVTSDALVFTGITEQIVHVVYSFASNNKHIQQILPFVGSNKIIIVETLKNGFNNCDVTFNAQNGETIDGVQNTGAISESGLFGIMFANPTTKNWDFINISSQPILQVATNEGATTYNASKLLFPFANGLVNDNGKITVNTSFIVTDENGEIVPDCSIIEVPTSSLISAIQNQGNSNAVVLDLKGIPIDTGDPTTVRNSKYLSFKGARIVTENGKDNLWIAPEITVDGQRQIESVSQIEVPTAGLLTAIGEADPDLAGKVYLAFGGLPTRKTANGTIHKAMEFRFPQGNVSSTIDGIVTIGTGHSISQGDDEITASCNAIVVPDNSGLIVEIDPNNPNGVILRSDGSGGSGGISFTNDDTQPVNQTTVVYMPQARFEDGSTTGSKIIKTSIPIDCGTDNFDDYKKLNFENNDFIIERDGTDNDKLNIKANGFSVETNNVETAGIKLLDFDSNNFNLDVSTEGIAKLTTKHTENNGFLAVYNHKQVIAGANAQEIYRMTALVPNSVVWQDDSIVYDKNSGAITLKYKGQNSEKQLFKIACRATVRRQLREADLGVWLYVLDTSTNDYLQDVNNETPIVNTTISKDLVSDYIEIADVFAIDKDTTVKIILKDDSPNKYVEVLDLAMGTSAIMVEKINAENQPSNALATYERLTQQTLRFVKHEFMPNFENAKSLIETTPVGNQDVPDDTVLQKDGWLIYFQDEGIYKQNTTPDGTTDCFQMVDKTGGFGYYNIARVLEYEDTWCLRGHEITAKVDRVEQTGEFAILPIVWRKRINEYAPKIITGMNNQGLYSTTDGWTIVDGSKTVITAPTPPETTASFTCNFTVPDDAVNVGFILMPTKQQTASIIKFTDFAIGCDPAFERWITLYPEQAIEAQLKKDSKYIKFVQRNTTPYDMSQWYQIPNGTAGDNNYSPLYTGEAQAGGNADITRIYDSTSSDFETLHNKGKFRFGKDGRVQVHYKIPVATDKFADGSDHNTFRIGFIKDTASGDILQGTPITQSLRDIPIPKSGNVFNDNVRTNGYANATFTMDVKENDEYWIALNPINVPRTAGNEGHMYSYPSGFIEFTFLENDYAINQLQSALQDLKSRIVFTENALNTSTKIKVDNTVDGNTPTVIATTL